MRLLCRTLVFLALSIAWIGIPFPTTGTPVAETEGSTRQGRIPIGDLSGDPRLFHPIIGPEIARTGGTYDAGWGIKPDLPENISMPMSVPPPPSLFPRAAFHGRQMFPGEDATSIPAVPFRAPLDCRAKTGREGTGPISPRYVRLAAEDIRSLIDKNLEKCRMFGVRGMEIASKIVLAEELGARIRTPRAFALAQAELNRARYVSLAGYYTISDTEYAFDEADKVSDSLLDLVKNGF